MMVDLFNLKLEVTWSTEEKAILDAAVALTEESDQPSYLENVLFFLYQHTQSLFISISRKTGNPGEMASLGLLYQGTLAPEQITYCLEGTPCEQVEKHQICYFPNYIQELFPSDVFLSDHDIESYLGVSLLNSSGEIMGLVTLMHQEPLANPHLTELILTILSPPLETLLEKLG